MKFLTSSASEHHLTPSIADGKLKASSVVQLNLREITHRSPHGLEEEVSTFEFWSTPDALRNLAQHLNVAADRADALEANMSQVPL